MLRTLTSAVARAAPRHAAQASRGFSAAHGGHVEQVVAAGKPSKEWIEFKKNLEHHAAETTDLWRKISFFVAVPTTLLGVLWSYRVESEHAEHEKHLREEHGGALPPVPEYDYLNKRAKPYPWGPNSLFFNPRTNKDMSQAL